MLCNSLSINRVVAKRQEDPPMLTTPKNKNELIDQLKREKDFHVLAVHNGQASAVAKEIAKHGNKQVSVIVIETR